MVEWIPPIFSQEIERLRKEVSDMRRNPRQPVGSKLEIPWPMVNKGLNIGNQARNLGSDWVFYIYLIHIYIYIKHICLYILYIYIYVRFKMMKTNKNGVLGQPRWWRIYENMFASENIDHGNYGRSMGGFLVWPTLPFSYCAKRREWGNDP